MKNTLTTGSHFSGYGSYLFALQSLGIRYKSLFACDINKYVRQTYQANHTTDKFYHDVTAEEVQNAPCVDLFISSPPCQSFSMAGNRGGVNDERGILFKYSQQYIKNKRPRFFIIENVKGLLSSEGGNTFKTWLNMLAKSVNGAGIQQSMFEDVSKDCAGYYVKWFVLNAKTHGWPHPVPQNRERVFIVGFRDIKDYSQFKAINKKKLNSKLFDILDDNVEPKYYLNSVRYLFPKKEDLKGFVYNGPYINGDTSQTITANYGNCPRTAQFIMTKNHTNLIKETIKKGNRAVNVNNEIAAFICASDYLKNQKEANYILLDGTKDAPKALRKLTPNECRKLMGLPETFIQPCSNSQAYKQYGNSIVVNCLAAIFKNMNLNQLT